MVLVAADGSHSLCRHRMKAMHQAYPTLKLMKHLANEFVGTAKFEGDELVTPVTLRMQITREEYQSVKDATFKNPLILATDASRVHTALMRDIRIWMNAKRKLFNEQSRDEKLICVVLSVYSAPDFATIRKKQDGTSFLMHASRGCCIWSPLLSIAQQRAAVRNAVGTMHRQVLDK